MKVVWTRLALADAETAIKHISDDSPAAGERMRERIKEAVEALRRHPEIGRTGRLEGTRELVIAGTPFIAGYVVERDTVEVFALIHGARRWPARK